MTIDDFMKSILRIVMWILEQIQILIATHWTESRDPYGGVTGRTEELKGIMTPQKE